MQSSKAKIMVSIFLISLLLLTAFPIGYAQEEPTTFTSTYTFKQPTIAQVSYGSETYDTITIEGLSNNGETGYPLLPSEGATLLLPYNQEMDTFSISTSPAINLGAGYTLEPAGIPYSLEQQDQLTPPMPLEAIYTSEEIYPQQSVQYIDTYIDHGYPVGVFEIFPITYVPATGELFYTETISITINTQSAQQKITTYRGLQVDYDRIIEDIDNPLQLTTYPTTSTKDRGYDMLIITTPTLSTSFEPLKAFHDDHGVSTIIKTTNDIGSTNPTVVRNFIRTYYSSQGIDYVLIGADDDLIPAIDLYVKTSWWNPEYCYDMPADLYFACLDGTYNYDGDSYWGEPSDGDGGGDVDLYADVYVGRAPVGTTTEVENFVFKTINYMYSGGDSYLSDVLMCGEYLGFGGSSDWGGNLMDELIGGSSSAGYSTTGIPTSQYSIDKLYDRDWSGNDWPVSEVKSRINNNVHIINHDGHGNIPYAMKMYSSELSTLTNTKYGFLYSQSCLAGHFDENDCFAEHFTVKYDNAGFAAIMNAREGWGVSYSTDGASQRFHREFWDAVFGEGKTTLGKANHDSKQDNVYRIGDSCMRWCLYELTLFGDPAVSFTNHYTNHAPAIPQPPVGPASGGIYEYLTFTAMTTDSDGQDIYYKFDWGDGTYSEWIGPEASGQSVDEQHRWSNEGTYSICVKARDTAGSETGWSDPAQVTIINNPPITPDRPSGETTGRYKNSYSYSASAEDPDGDNVYIQFYWGDGESTQWLGPYSSGESVTTSHVWQEQGSFNVKVKAKDVHGEESEWSDPLPVTMPYTPHDFLNLLIERLIQRFPFLESLF